MNSSGIKRGLAAAAVSALAVAGLPLLAGSAHAAEAGFYNGVNDVDLITGENSTIWDTAFDGANNNIHLVATGGTNVSEVLFEFQKAGDPTWTTIARVSRSAGQVFSTSWVPTGFALLDAVSVRATGYAANNAVLNQETDTNLIQGGAQTIDIGNAAGSSVGVFQQPYAGLLLQGAIHGTRNGLNAPFFLPSGPIGAMTVEDVTGTPDGLGIRTWSAPLNITGYAFGGSNTVALEAFTGGGFDSDAEGLVVYNQTISGATIGANPTSIATPPGGNTVITLKVTDQNGQPVVGAQIASNDAGAPDTGNDEGTANTGTDIQGYTNSQGELKLTRPANTAPAANYRYWVNTTANVDYQVGTDFLLTTHVGTYTPVITTVAISSADGDAFDLDENVAADIRARILDQSNNPVAGATPIKYTWSVDPFDDSPVWTATGTAANSDAQGYTNIPLPVPGANDPEGVYTLLVYVDNNGTPGLQATDPQGTKNLKAGQANVTWTAGDRTQVAAGSKSVLTGTLTLDDSTVLPGRFVTVTRQSLGTEETGSPDAFISVQADQPADTNTISPTEASAKTNAAGTFSVSITDPVENPQGKEIGDVFRGAFGPTGGTFMQDDITVDFLRSLTPATIAFTGQANLIDGNATPGRPVSVFFEVRNAHGDLLTDAPVTISVDHGFLTPYAAAEGTLTPDPAPANGADYGLWKNIGTSDATGATADAPAGQARATVAVERDPGFDDDGVLDINVTATAGSATVTEPIGFSTDYDVIGGNPLNQGVVDLSLQDDAFQDSSILPDARVDQAVGFNLTATDSFGNLIDDEVDVSDDTADAEVDGSTTTSVVDSQFTADIAAGNGAFFATSDVPGTVQTASADLTNTGTQYVDNPATVVVDITKTTTPNETDTDTEAPINWYAVDFADPATQLLFSNDEAGEVPVGTPVHSEVEIIDQKGQPVDNMNVTFVRRGPNVQQGDFNVFDSTDSNGIATYDWVGTTAGTADVSAFVYNTYGPPSVSDGRLVKKLTSAKIIFKGDNPPQQAISPVLSGRNNTAGKDILTVSAKKAVGATVKLFKIKNGKRVLINQKTIKANGTVTFKVADKNGNKRTTYVAKVKPTTTTLGATTNKVRVK